MRWFSTGPFRMIFGAAPAWFATRTDPADALRGSGRGTSDRSTFARKALLIVQATLSVVLVAGATMLARSLNKLEHQDFGYKVNGRVVVSLPQLQGRIFAAEADRALSPTGRAARAFARCAEHGLALYNPLTDNWGELILVEGHPLSKITEESGASCDRVSADYLKNFGVSVLRGRGFTAADNETSELVAVVNEASSSVSKNNEEPLRSILALTCRNMRELSGIVGVVRDAKFPAGA